EVVDMSSAPEYRVNVLANRHPHLRPKAVSFTDDGEYAAIVYSPVVSECSLGVRQNGRIEIRRFSSERGLIDEACEAVLHDDSSLLEGLELAEFGRRIGPGRYRLFAANQAHDMVAEILFDAETMSLTASGRRISGVSFPHGISIGGRENLLAITCYGD